MDQLTVTIRMDRELKNKAEALFTSLDLDLTTAIRMFLERAVREQRMPFELTQDLLNEETLQVLREVEEGKNLMGPFDSAEALLEQLRADD